MADQQTDALGAQARHQEPLTDAESAELNRILARVFLPTFTEREREIAYVAARTALTAATAAQETETEKWREMWEAINRTQQKAKLTAQEAEIARLREIEAKYRRTLWLGHGCTHALYGDDGEMQCNDIALHGALDFKRDTLDRLEQRVYEAKLKRLGASHDT